MKNSEIIAVCERFGIEEQDHVEFVQLVQWGKIGRPGYGFGLRIVRRKVYKACLAQILDILTQRAA